MTPQDGVAGKLDACPFLSCGGTATITSGGAYDIGEYLLVACSACGASLRKFHWDETPYAQAHGSFVSRADARAAAIAFWNARRASPSEEEVRARIANLEGALRDAIETVRSVPARWAGSNKLHSPQVGALQVERWDAVLSGGVAVTHSGDGADDA